MRLLRRVAASFWLTSGLVGLVAVAVTTLAFGAASPAQAARAYPARSTVAAVTPSATTPGTAVTFAVTCASPQAASATLFAATLGLPEQIPMEAGTASGAFVISVTLPTSIRPGIYRPDIDCSDGTSATATLRVTALPAQGGAQTGDGTTSTRTNTGLAAVGLVLIAVGAVTGGIAIRRRTSGTRH